MSTRGCEPNVSTHPFQTMNFIVCISSSSCACLPRLCCCCCLRQSACRRGIQDPHYPHYPPAPVSTIQLLHLITTMFSVYTNVHFLCSVAQEQKQNGRV